MNKYKTEIKVISFILIMTVILASADRVLMVKYVDGIYSIKRFYELEDDTVDVLFLGSSHVFETYNTSVLWDDYGIASFVLGGSVQPMWNTYFYMKEALKTQTPDLIVLDALYCTLNDYTDYSRQIKNCYGMKPSLNKLNAMLVSSSYDNINFFFPISNYSSRYGELTKEDFLESKDIPRYKNWMGFGSNYQNEVENTPRIEDPDVETPMPQETEKYYRKILQLANEKQIPLLVVVTPYPDINEDSAAIYKYAERIAGEYNADFINPALDPAAIGLDFSIHAAEGNHLNSVGNRIYTSYFGDYIKSHYSIHDRRGDPDYRSWEECSTYIKRVDSVKHLNNQTDLESICKQIKDEQFCAAVIVGNGFSNASEVLKPLGASEIEPSTVSIYNKGTILPWIKHTNSVTYEEIYMLFHDDLVYSDRNRLAQEYSADDSIIKIIVYDTVTDDVCDVFSIAETNPKTVYR